MTKGYITGLQVITSHLQKILTLPGLGCFENLMTKLLWWFKYDLFQTGFFKI